MSVIKKYHTTRPRMRDCKQNLTGSALQLVYDPMDEFSAGAVFVREEHINMLKMNCYNLGTILKDATGCKFIVKQGNAHQILVKL